MLAGVTVAAYLVPQVMAYAEVAGLPPVVGLWAISGPLLVYAVLGSSRQLSVGPESTTALMTAVAVAPLAAGDPARYAALAAALALVVGGLCLVARVARLGFLADLLSKPVLVGYMAGIAVLMIVSQLEKVTGVPVDRGRASWPRSASFVGGLDQVHPPTALLAVGGPGPAPGRAAALPARAGAADRHAASPSAAVAALSTSGTQGIRLVGDDPGQRCPSVGLPDVGLGRPHRPARARRSA